MQKLQSALSVVLKLVMQWSHSIILTILSIVSLQFQGQFVPISLRPVLRIVAAHVRLQSGLHVVNFFHLLGVSVSTK